MSSMPPKWVSVYVQGSRPAVWLRTVERGKKKGWYELAFPTLDGSFRRKIVRPDVVDTDREIRTSLSAEVVAKLFA